MNNAKGALDIAISRYILYSILMKKYTRALGAVTATSLLFAGCSSPETQPRLPEQSTTTSTKLAEQTPWPDADSSLDMSHVSFTFGLPELAGFDPQFIDREVVGGQIIDLQTTEALANYQEFTRRSAEFLSEWVVALPSFDLAFDQDHRITYTPKPRVSSVYSLVLAPQEYETSFPAIAQTRFMNFTDQAGNPAYTRAISFVVAGDGSDYTSNSTAFRLFTEICQGLVVAEATDSSTGTKVDEVYQTQGQELLCNSLAIAYAAARAGYDHKRYINLVQSDTVDVTGLKLPTLQLADVSYEQLREFANTLGGMPI